jgi:hypothetical protein
MHFLRVSDGICISENISKKTCIKNDTLFFINYTYFFGKGLRLSRRLITVVRRVTVVNGMHK